MSAKVFSSPKGYDAPPFDFNMSWEDRNKQDEQYLEHLKQWCLDNTNAPISRRGIIGEVIRFPVADNYARYMVFTTKPLTLIHISMYDGYHADPILLRGLRANDVQEMIRQNQLITKLFA